MDKDRTLSNLLGAIGTLIEKPSTGRTVAVDLDALHNLCDTYRAAIDHADGGPASVFDPLDGGEWASYGDEGGPRDADGNNRAGSWPDRGET